jgi:hypothetical protein
MPPEKSRIGVQPGPSEPGDAQDQCMQWTTVDAADAVSAVALELALTHAQAALAALEQVRVTGPGLLAATAWASPAMDAFLERQDEWLAGLERNARALRAFLDAVDVARAGSVASSGSLLP